MCIFNWYRRLTSFLALVTSSTISGTKKPSNPWWSSPFWARPEAKNCQESKYKHIINKIWNGPTVVWQENLSVFFFSICCITRRNLELQKALCSFAGQLYSTVHVHVYHYLQSNLKGRGERKISKSLRWRLSCIIYNDWFPPNNYFLFLTNKIPRLHRIQTTF